METISKDMSEVVELDVGGIGLVGVRRYCLLAIRFYVYCKVERLSFWP